MTDRPLRRPSRSLRAQGLCKVTVLVPEGCAEGIRQFAQELRDRQPIGPVPEMPKWRAISPSAELMVSPDCSARCSVRDTRAPGADRFRWTVAVLGQLDPIAEGRAENRVEAVARGGRGSSIFRGPGRAVRRRECARWLMGG
jgi:hypothetical protein